MLDNLDSSSTLSHVAIKTLLIHLAVFSGY